MPPDPEQSVGQLLRRSFRAHKEPATDSSCLDGETLAAWMDGGLSASQISLAEAHLAQCARCQAMAAAIVRSAPPIPVAARWWRSRWGLGLLVPLTAGAAAVVLWIAVPREKPSLPAPRESTMELSQAARGQGASASPAPASVDRLEALQVPETERQRFDADSKPKTAPADGREIRAESVPRSSDTLGRMADSARASAPSAASVPSAAPAQAAESAAPSNRAPAPLQAGAAMSRSAALSGPRVIESPDPKIRWRLGVPGVVQRSTDGGASWEDLATGVPGDLTTGAAPSTSVCWIVGRQGTVLRTTDGRRWQRIPFPHVVDLIAVQATDASSAAVTTADGRTFRTADGGNSWIPASLQEF